MAPWNPTAAGTVLWLEALDTSVTIGTGVSSWADGSDNSYDLSQSTTGQQPSYVTDTYVEFDGVDDKLDIASKLGLTGNPEILVIAVVEFLSNVSGTDMLWQVGGNSAGVLAVAGGTDGYSWRFNNGNAVFDSVTLNEKQLVAFYRSTGDTYGDSSFRLNGSEQTTTSTSNPTNTPDISVVNSYCSIGSGLNSVSDENQSNVRVYEFIVVEDISELEKYEGYLAHEHDLESELPVDHPYKDAVPLADAKSVIVDITNGHGGNYVGVRRVRFYDSSDDLISVDPSVDGTAYATTSNGTRLPEYAFNTSLSLVDSSAATQWLSSTNNNTNQRLSFVFTSNQDIAKVVIDNAHHYGTTTELGAKDIIVYSSTDAITSTTYGETVTNSTELFNNALPSHSEVNEEDPFQVYPFEGYPADGDGEFILFEGDGVGYGETPTAVGDGEFMLFEGEGEASTENYGDGVFMLFQGFGRAGKPRTVEAHGEFFLFAGEGYTGAVVKGEFPLFEASGQSLVTKLANGDAVFPLFQGEGVAVAPLMARGHGDFPLFQGEASSRITRIAIGDGYFPLFQGEGKENAVAEGDGKFFLFEAFGQADCERDSYGILSYQRGTVR